MPAEATIKAIVKEKGISNGKDSWLSRMGQGLSAGVMLVEEAAMGRKGLGVPKAYTETISLASLLSSKADGDGFVEVRLPISKLAAGPISALGYAKSLDAGDVVVFRMRWLNFTALKKTWAKSDSLWTGAASTYHFSCQGKAQYEPIGVEQVLRIEGCEGLGTRGRLITGTTHCTTIGALVSHLFVACELFTESTFPPRSLSRCGCRVFA